MVSILRNLVKKNLVDRQVGVFLLINAVLQKVR